MTEEVAPDPVDISGAWRLLLTAGLLTALAGSLWAWLAGTGCAACVSASSFLGDLPLGQIGVFAYTLLLLLSLRFHRHRAFHIALFFAAGLHLGLVGVLAARQSFCLPCLITAAGAIAAAAVPLARDPDAFPRAAVTLLLTLVVFNGAMFAVAKMRADRQLVAAREEAALAAQIPVAQGDARLIVYYIPGCAACRDVEKNLVPQVIRQHPGKISLVQRPPRTGLPYPMVIVTGREGWLFASRPDPDALERAVRGALGESRGEPPPRGGYSLQPAPLPGSS